VFGPEGAFGKGREPGDYWRGGKGRGGKGRPGGKRVTGWAE